MPKNQKVSTRDNKIEEIVEESELLTSEEIYPLDNEVQTVKERETETEGNGIQRKGRKRQGKRKTTSPRKKGKAREKLHKCLDQENSSNEEDILGTESSRPKVTVCFREEDNEYVEMDIENEDEFPAVEGNDDDNVNELITQSSSEEEDGEISFNNNSSAQGVLKKTLDKSKDSKKKEELEKKRISETDEERETRIVNKTMERLQAMLASGGYFKDKPNPQVLKSGPARPRDIGKARGKGKVTEVSVNESLSESTIYQGTVQPAKALDNDQGPCLSITNQPNLLRFSSSSEDEPINTPEEQVGDAKLAEKTSDFLTCIRNCNDNGKIPGLRADEPQPSTSRNPQGGIPREAFRPGHQVLEDNVSRFIREAETSCARVLEPQGNGNFHVLNDQNCARVGKGNELKGDNFVLFGPNQYMKTAIMDEDYLIVAAHIDENLERRVRNGEYIDFVRLLPHDRVQMQQDNRIKLINQNGHLSCAPASENSNLGLVISSFARWEHAFRVFSNTYTRQFPQRASELIQYNHIIHTASMSYSWSNVYAYDIDFRLHMARHPQRSCSVILQQAWNFRLKDRHEGGGRSTGNSSSYSNKRREICFRYNAGRCTFGSRCKFNHRCGICRKYGHGAHNCRRIFDKDSFDRYAKGDHTD